jgi:putative peptide zinc metalloprotease protein
MGRGGAKARVPVNVVLQDPANRVSSVHAAISYREEDNVLILTDQGSSNGTRLNAQFIGGATPLFPGDTLNLGSLDLLLMLPDPEGETGYFQTIPRKRGGLVWELLEDGEPGIARLEVVDNQLRNQQGQPEPPRKGAFYRLTPRHPFVIGRYSTNDIQVADLMVGRRHAEIRWIDNSYIINDLGAAHPAQVNGEALVAPRRLMEDDIITIGQVVLRYRAPRRPYLPSLQPDKADNKTGIKGGALRFVTNGRGLQLGADFIRLPVDRQVLIGRDESNDLRLRDQSVSRRHARLVVERGHFMITDEGSTNATLVNTLEIGGPTILKTGDRLKIGDFEFVFEELEAEDQLTDQPEEEDEEEVDTESRTIDREVGEIPAEPPKKQAKHPLLAGDPLTLELANKPTGTEAADGSAPAEKLAQATDAIVITHPLRGIAPFNKLDTANFNLLVKYFREVSFKAGQEIAREGQGRGAFYAILEGTVTISRSLDQGRSRLVLGELGKGTVYGERTIFADQPFVNRLEAKTDVKALILEESIFVREFSRNRTITAFFQQQVSTNSAANWLKGNMLMQTFSDSTRQELAERLRYRVYAAGETLAKKGDPCEEFFLIVSGTATAVSVDNKGNETTLTALEEGDTFGDGIAVQGETYPLTVRAERLVECYVLARADFQKVVQKSGDPIARLSGLPIGAVLNRIPPFNTMPPQLVAQIGSRMKVKYFKKGEVIAWQGDRSSALYIVRSGQVQLSYRTSDGTVRQDAKLGPGQFFGEASLLQETVHSATVTAIEDCELLTLFRNKVEEVMALGEGYDLAQFFRKNLERRFRPKRVAHFQVAEQTSTEGETFYMLSTADGESFFRLSERGYFLWQRMDGDNTISDLALDYFMEYKTLDLEAVSNIVGQLQAAGFLQVPAVNQSLIKNEEQGKTGGNRFSHFLTYRHEIKDIDGLVEKIYRYGGKFIFFKPVLWTLFAIMGLGFVSFFYFAFFSGSGQDASFLIKPPVSVFTGPFWWLLILAALLNFAIHESAHALACKSYGRKVSRGGFGWMYVGPYFFVNTDDIYLEKRKARIVVDLAGPASNVLIGSVCCLLMFLNQDKSYQTLLFQLASVAYLIAYLNVIPLTESDGYYALSNWLEIPSLRKKALGWMRRRLLRQPETRAISARERKVYFWFALLTPAYLVIIMVQFILWLGNILNALLEGWLGWDLTAGVWVITTLIAIILTLPLFADLVSAGQSEEEREQKKKKARRSGGQRN